MGRIYTAGLRRDFLRLVNLEYLNVIDDPGRRIIASSGAQSYPHVTGRASTENSVVIRDSPLPSRVCSAGGSYNSTGCSGAFNVVVKAFDNVARSGFL